MVLFRVVLDLNNFQELHDLQETNQQKAQKTLKFYKVLAKMIVFFHNKDINNTSRLFPEYNEPYLKLCKNLFVFRDATSDNTIIKDVIKSLFPPRIEIDFEFKIHPVNERKAVSEYYKTIKNRRYKNLISKNNSIDIKKLYYSTKITNFINNLNNMLHSNDFWKIFCEKKLLETKYIPNITVSDSIIFSLH